MKRTARRITALLLCIGLISGMTAISCAESFTKTVYSYKTNTLNESDRSNAYSGLFDYSLRVPNYLGKISTTLKTSQGSGETDVIVIYVPEDEWDGQNYYSGITGTVTNNYGMHMYSGSDAIVGWKEFYDYGYLSVNGGMYYYNKGGVSMDFMQGPGLYTGLAVASFSSYNTGYEKYEDAHAKLGDDGIYMTAVGYSFVLILDDASIDYFLENGVLTEGGKCRWNGLRELLLDSRYAVTTPTEDAGLANFAVKTPSYVPGIFSDVPAGDTSWYCTSIQKVYDMGLMRGSGSKFKPADNISLAEVLTMAARLRNIYDGGTGTFANGRDLWYSTYVDYCIAEGIIRPTDFSDYARPATRAEMAYIFASALPRAAYAQINDITSIPDVSSATPYDSEIFLLYRAGVLTGYSDRSFAPSNNISRAEAAAIISRVADKSLRVTLKEN